MDFNAIANILESYPATVAAIAAVIAAVGVIAAFAANAQNRRQYIDSIQPQLSMALLEFDYQLFLQISNTGGLPARNINITVKKICNNGQQNDLALEDLFRMPFELYPTEKVQGRVAIFGTNMQDTAFPQVEINVAYTYGRMRRKVCYSRTVTYAGQYGEKVCADVHLDTRDQDQALRTTARAAVRLANYFDGRQVTSFDELEILANRSLAGDLESVNRGKIKHILSRSETIQEALGRGQKQNTDRLQGHITVVPKKKKG